MGEIFSVTFNFHPDAEAEFNEAIDYFENKQVGLGRDFAIEVYLTIDRVLSFPKAWAILEGKIRRSLVNRFPYGLLYAEENGGIFILAVMHLHRDPDYWKYRM